MSLYPLLLIALLWPLSLYFAYRIGFSRGAMDASFRSLRKAFDRMAQLPGQDRPDVEEQQRP